jgi:hypothetical protein
MGQAEIVYKKYSSIEEAISLLAHEIPRGRGESFLVELANLKQTDSEGISRFLKRYPEFIIPQQAESGKARLASGSPAVEVGLYQVDDSLPRAMFSIQVLLRRAWERPTSLDREVSLTLAQQTVYEAFLRAFDRGKTETPIWRVLGYIFLAFAAAKRLADRFRRCENPTCPASYFIAKRRSQKYCSEVCAGHGQRELKRKWWNEYGEEWRKKSRKQKNKSRRA